MSEKPRPSHDQVLSILDDLDSFAPVPANPATPSLGSTTKNPKTASTAAGAAINSNSKLTNKPAPSNPGDAQSVLDFIDEITQRSSTPTASIATKKITSSRPVSRKPSNSSIGSRPAADQRASEPLEPPVVQGASSPLPSPAAAGAPSSSSASSWGWGSVLKQATSSVLNQAMSAAGQNFNSNLHSQLSGQSEAAKKWKEGVLGYVRASGIDQLGKDLQATGIKSLTDIINMVAPPISKHEVIDVQLSYDMVGYDGIEDLVYRSLSKVMEQVDGGDLILNKGDEERPKPSESAGPERDLQAAEGMIDGYKLALANLEQMIQRIEGKKAELKMKEASGEGSAPQTGEGGELPITHCPVYVRIQPIISRLPVFGPTPSTTTRGSKATMLEVAQQQGQQGVTVDMEGHLFFLVLLRDVKNSLDHTTLTQSIPATWLEIPFEENEWVEDIMVDVIRRGIEIIGQQYVNGRISGRSVRNTSAEDDGHHQQAAPSSASSAPPQDHIQPTSSSDPLSSSIHLPKHTPSL
ncbi:hypothetical protein VP01_628g6 [Puccinia sorghi]|uniref:Maintenance of telomere capping protein 1 n=1 Tax=Puccinia sorghi TaxID=27349 RepID=A0A0L6UGC3_9BASI|nr:hypothetical protein VP01_628g6 [Puccinia sorghi]